MVLYFTGTGNSRYIAEKISEKTSDEMISINEKIKQKDNSTIVVNGKLVFVMPTYAWRIPAVVKEWIFKTEFLGVKQVWFIMTCGSEIGNATKYNKEICEQKGIAYKGTAQIDMPENYIAMFDVPGKEEAKQIISKAEPVIENIIGLIKEERCFPVPRNNLYDRFMSGPVNKMFYSLFVKADAFKVDDKCIGCGKCEKICPLNNIKIQNGKPVWGKECTHCMACICHCPTEAIEYGKKSIGKPRYHI